MYVTHPRPQGSEVFQTCKVASESGKGTVGGKKVLFADS